MVEYSILKETLQPEPGNAVKEVFFTTKDRCLYAITPRWPGKQLVIKNYQANDKTRVAFPTTGQELAWRNTNGNLVIDLPGFDPDKVAPEHMFAYVFRIENY